MADSGDVLLEVRDLKVHFDTPDGVVKAVDGVSFIVEEGQTLGVVGESGSGKSVSFLTIMGLVNRRHAHIEGQILFKGRDLLEVSAEDLRRIRGAEMAMIFQDPMTSLHPMYRVGDQIVEAITAHGAMDKKQGAVHAVDMLRRVGIPLPEERARQYPHEYSGGMRQRAMIAMAMCLNPSLLIADEPTTALDVTVQAQILELIEAVKQEFRVGVVLITHDLGVVADVSQQVMVMYAGRAVEYGTRQQVFDHPLHPYSWGLLESIPNIERTSERLIPIEGSPPSLIHVPNGCAFHPRCPHRFEPCDNQVPLLENRGGDHPDACHLSIEDKRRLWDQRESRRTREAV